MKKFTILTSLALLATSAVASENHAQDAHKAITTHEQANHHASHSEPSFINRIPGVKSIGTFEAEIGFYYQDFSKRDQNKHRQELGNVWTDIKFETHEWHGLQLGIRGRLMAETADNHHDYLHEIEDESILSEIYLKYSFADSNILLGRQQMDWIMLQDYYEGAFLESNYFEDFTMRLAWVNRSAIVDPEEVKNWGDMNPNENGHDSDGVWGGELTWHGLKGLELTGLFYHGNGAYTLYGGRGLLETHLSHERTNTFKAEYFIIDQNDNNELTEGGRGSIFHINDTVEFGRATVGAGYIDAGEDVGAGEMISHPWNPFKFENFHEDQTSFENARTWYVTADYKLTDKFHIETVYGQTQTEEGAHESSTISELDITLAYHITHNFRVETGYVHVETDDHVEHGHDKYWFETVYTF